MRRTTGFTPVGTQCVHHPPSGSCAVFILLLFVVSHLLPYVRWQQSQDPYCSYRVFFYPDSSIAGVRAGAGAPLADMGVVDGPHLAPTRAARFASLEVFLAPKRNVPLDGEDFAKRQIAGQQEVDGHTNNPEQSNQDSHPPARARPWACRPGRGRDRRWSDECPASWQWYSRLGDCCDRDLAGSARVTGLLVASRPGYRPGWLAMQPQPP